MGAYLERLNAGVERADTIYSKDSLLLITWAKAWQLLSTMTWPQLHRLKPFEPHLELSRHFSDAADCGT